MINVDSSTVAIFKKKISPFLKTALYKNAFVFSIKLLFPRLNAMLNLKKNKKGNFKKIVNFKTVMKNVFLFYSNY